MKDDNLITLLLNTLIWAKNNVLKEINMESGDNCGIKYCSNIRTC